MVLACPVEADSGIRNDPDPTLRRPSRFATAEDSVAVAHVILAERPVALLGGLGPSRTARSRLPIHLGSAGRPAPVEGDTAIAEPMLDDRTWGGIRLVVLRLYSRGLDVLTR